MADEIKMDYPLMEEMQRTFQSGRETLAETIGELKNIADKMEGGALLGDAGEAFADAVKAVLVDQVQKLSDKFEELEGDLAVAVNKMREAEKNTEKSFS
jgi:WXG100 family type VII secretion target